MILTFSFNAKACTHQVRTVRFLPCYCISARDCLLVFSEEDSYVYCSVNEDNYECFSIKKTVFIDCSCMRDIYGRECKRDSSDSSIVLCVLSVCLDLPLCIFFNTTSQAVYSQKQRSAEGQTYSVCATIVA